MRLTKDRFERYLNETYSPNIAECIHFTEKAIGRPYPISRVKLQIAIDRKKYGKLLRKYDKQEFEKEFINWCKKFKNE